MIVRLLPVVVAIVRGGLVRHELLPKRGDEALLLSSGDIAKEGGETVHL